MIHRRLTIWLLATLASFATPALAQESKSSALASLDLTGVDPDVKKSIQTAVEEVRQSPASDKTWGGLGMLLVAHGFYDASEICFIRAERLNPQEHRWPYFHATALVVSDPQAAARLALAAAQRCRDVPDVPRLRAAELLLSVDRFDEARTHFQKVLTKSPDHPRAHLGLARLATRRGEYEDAIKHLEKSKDHASAKKASQQLLAQVHLLRGDRTAAERAQREAAAILVDRAWPDPLSDEIGELRTGKKTYLARLDKMLAFNQIDEAHALGQAAVKKYPDSEWTWTLLARALIKKRDYTAAEKALQKALDLAPESIEALFRLGVVHMHQKRNKEALASFRRAIQFKSDFAMAHYNVAQCLLTDRDESGAIAALKSAVRYQPDLFAGHWQLGNLLAKHEQYEESAVHLQNALRLNEHPQVRRLLVEVEKKSAATKSR